jgi:DNA-binding protein HU-beta
MTNVIGDEIANGEKVLIVGFGAFEAVNRKEREGRNPKTGEKILIPAAKVPSFSPGKELREKVAG